MHWLVNPVNQTVDRPRISPVRFQVRTGTDLGLKVVAVLSQMDHPIGLCIGNALEVMETLECLHGEGPEDLNDLVVTLGKEYTERIRELPPSPTPFYIPHNTCCFKKHENLPLKTQK